MTDIFDRAIVFATKAHKGVNRKGNSLPYIIHPLEAATVVATMTEDKELLAAAVLHDVIEDTDFSYEDLKKEFGKRVADIVLAESDDKKSDDEYKKQWFETKTKTMERLKNSERDVKIVALGDKLSNMRAIYSDYEKYGDDLWQKFQIKEKSAHAWHYRTLAAALSSLKGEKAYAEFEGLVNALFGKSE